MINKFVVLGFIVTICTKMIGTNEVLMYKTMDVKFSAMELKLEAVCIEMMNNQHILKIEAEETEQSMQEIE